MLSVLLASSIPGLATGLGAVVVLLFGKPSQKALSAMLGFAAGVMIAISAFNLMEGAAAVGSTASAIVGLAAGVLLMFALDLLVPHSHIGSAQPDKTSGGIPEGSNHATTVPERDRACHGHDAGAPGQRYGATSSPDVLKTGYLIFLGIALHNLPEGLAIGAGYTASGAMGLSIAVAIALHDVPEGMATAVPLLLGGAGKLKTVVLTTISGLMTPVGTLMGQAVFQASPSLVSIALAFAAGAMVYIASDELIPQSHSLHSHLANFGFLAGFVLGFMLG